MRSPDGGSTAGLLIPFTKAHGAGNDFLLTFASGLSPAPPDEQFPKIARAICHRNTGIGADGWYLIDSPAAGADARVRLWNSDGSKAELSGNGTRCAAALLVDRGMASDRVLIQTGAGLKELRFEGRRDGALWFEMEMGRPVPGDLHFPLPLPAGVREVAIIDVGNPQCAVVVDDFDFDWVSLGAEIEAHPHFPNRTNVSFIRRKDEHTIEARFYERGAGHTLSSGTGSTGAAGVALMLGLVSTPVTVETEFCPLYIRKGATGLEEGGSLYLTGPAEILASGQYLFGRV
ncbi:MAG: diaminopimelate epimerase [Bryobacteraceae bacterium]